MEISFKSVWALVNHLVHFYTVVSLISPITGNFGSEKDGKSLQREQNVSVPASPAPQITIVQQRLNLDCNDTSADEFEFDGDSSPCYEVIPTTFSQEFDNDAILGTLGDRLIFRCSAPYVTRWIVTLLPTKGTSYIESRREDQNPFNTSNATFTNEFRLVVSKNAVSSGSSFGASGWVKCQSGLNPSENQTSGIYIFSQTGDAMISDELNEKKFDLTGPLEIKCLANYPDVRPKLEEEIEDDYEEIDPDRILKPYDPRYGFLIQGSDKLVQTYRCVTEDTDDRDAHEFLHHFETIQVTSHDTDHENTTHSSVEKLLLDTGYSGTAEHIGQDTNERLSDISCEADKIHNIILKMLRCKSVHHCDWLSTCFENCYLKYDAEVLEKRSTTKIVSLTNPFFGGMTRCRVWKGSTLSNKYYFVGLDRFSYFTEKENIPKDALIRLNTEDRDFYTYQSTQFLCEISTFILLPNIRFAVVYRNGTKSLIESSTEPTNATATAVSSVLIEYESLAFAQRELKINLTRDMSEILCLAPWHNSSQWIEQAISFKPKDVVKPSIDKPDGSEKRTLYSGLNDQILHCSAFGDPKPLLTWILPDPALKSIITLPEANEGETNLYFPIVEDFKIFTGKYICVASSNFGNDTFAFDVHGEDLRLGPGVISGISFAGLGFLTLVAAIIYFGCKYHFAKNKIRDLTEEEIKEFTEGIETGENTANTEPTNPENAKQRAFKKSYVLAEEDLIIARDCVLGQGEYGMVYRGILHGDAVAVKTTKPNADVSYFKALLLELKIMGYIGDHPHVVNFRGAVTNRIRERIIFAVLELSPLGNLNSFLRKLGSGFFNLLPNVEGNIATYENCNATVTQVNMINWCAQIADGMDYLSSKHVCHGDLAARNVLVFKNDIVKITDFGLSKQLYNYTNYVKKKLVPLPWRWLAIETIRFMEFSSKSDVWAFGVTMWEIFSLSQVPYPGQTYTMDFAEKLLEGLRLKKPLFAPTPVYDLMIQTWHEHPDFRPTFAKLRDDLNAIQKDDNMFKTESETTNRAVLNVYTKASSLPESTPRAPMMKDTELTHSKSKPIPKPRSLKKKRNPNRVTYINVRKT